MEVPARDSSAPMKRNLASESANTSRRTSALYFPENHPRNEKQNIQPQPTADWVAVHGNSVISDAERPVNIEHHSRFAVVSPKVGTDHWSTGIVHFALPSAPNGSIRPTRFLAEFETTLARPYKLEIFYGGSEVFRSTLSEHDSLESLDVTCISPLGVESGRCGHGINVTITIAFRQTSSSIAFESVGLVFVR